MDKTELEIKRDQNRRNDIAEKRELVSNTKTVTKKELLLKFVAKDVIRNMMFTVAVQMFIEFEKDSDNSNQIIKC